MPLSRTSRTLLSLLTTTALFTAACSSATSDPASEADAIGQTHYSPYPYAMRSIHKLGQLDPFNTSIADFGSPVRNQGKIASCASHGFLGVIENQLFVERGVTTDLSERFMLYANFMQSKNMGNQPSVIQRFPEIADEWGILPEDVWQYSEIDANASRFEQDVAQGLSTDPNAQTIDKAIAMTPAASEARGAILERPEFLGRLPDGPYPITLPLKADLAAGAVVPQVEFEGRIYDCFATDPASLPPEQRLKVTPRELVNKCLDIDPKTYFTCAHDLEAIANDAEREGLQGDDCQKATTLTDRMGAVIAKRNTEWLNLTMRLIDEGHAVMTGVESPAAFRGLSVWFGKGLQAGGGHAVVVVGYVTYEELATVEEQQRGMLGQGIFDKLAGAVDPDYAARIAAGTLPSDPTALRDARIATKLGKLVKDEGGLLLFRNSWGARVGQDEIGVEGYQSMTFDFFLKAATLVQGRAAPRIGGVGWQPDAGPASCPGVAIPTSDPWLMVDRSAAVASYYRSRFVPATCPAR